MDWLDIVRNSKTVVLYEGRKGYPPRPDTDKPVKYVGRGIPTDSRDGDIWEQPV